MTGSGEGTRETAPLSRSRGRASIVRGLFSKGLDQSAIGTHGQPDLRRAVLVGKTHSQPAIFLYLQPAATFPLLIREFKTSSLDHRCSEDPTRCSRAVDATQRNPQQSGYAQRRETVGQRRVP